MRGLKGREMCFARFSCVEKIADGQFGGSHGTSWFHLFLLTFGQKNNQSRSGVFLVIWLYQGVLGMRCTSGDFTLNFFHPPSAVHAKVEVY